MHLTVPQAAVRCIADTKWESTALGEALRTFCQLLRAALGSATCTLGHRAAQYLGQVQRQPPLLCEVVESAGGAAAQLAVALVSSLDICAGDNADNTNCADSRPDLPLIDEDSIEHFNPYPDARWLYVNNRLTHELLCAGWHLISSPVRPYDADIEEVLADLIARGTVEGVWTMAYEGAPLKPAWKHWTPRAGPVDTLTKIVDGQGYWIKMKAPDTLTIVGTWMTLGDGETPPEYHVHDGWNLIGYTHWAWPTIWSTETTVADYLAFQRSATA